LPIVLTPAGANHQQQAQVKPHIDDTSIDLTYVFDGIIVLDYVPVTG